MPSPSPPPVLPISEHEDEIVAAVDANPVVVVIGETGSGKSTQLSQILHRRGYTRWGAIAVTQPRRVAAVSVSRRVAQELGVPLGGEVGYAIRFEDRTSERTCIKYLTDGVLLRESLSNPELKQYSVIILDEAHERSLNTDILLGLMKRLIKDRASDLKVLITSATLDGLKVSKFFSGCPVLNIPGTLFPVEKFYSSERPTNYIESSLRTAIDIHAKELLGDVLIFMTGKDDIDKMVSKLEERIQNLEEGSCMDALVLPLHGSLPPELQVRVFAPAPPNCRRFIVATNVAETSLTVDGVVGERTVKKLRLSKALTIPEGTTVSEACWRMAARRVDAVLLTDANGLLSGIVTDKDIATRVIAEGLRVEQTIISKIMTRNPLYVTVDTLAIEALQKMVQGKFRHLPVVENGEVVAMLDIAKCLYDAISRLEKAAEQGSALAAAVEGVERQLGGNISGPHNLIETLKERMFKPSLSTIITENTKVAIVSPSDPVCVATQKMRELRVNSVIITAGNSLHGIFTSKDVLMRVVAQNLSPELTLVEKVMTAHPDSATLDTTILDALHIMHDGKFLHIPVLDGDGRVAACLDVLQLTHAAISMVEESPETANDVANTIMQKFWDSALALEPPDEDFDSRSELSLVMPSEAADGKGSIYPPAVGNSCAFKIQDQKGRMHRFTCGSESLDELMSSVMQRLGIDGEKNAVQLLYEDDEGDKVLLTTDFDLAAAVLYAKSSGLKALRLHIDDSDSKKEVTQPLSETTLSYGSQLMHVHYGLMACAIALTGVAVMVYLRHSKS